MDALTAAWNARWKAIARDNADWNYNFGLDKAWRDNFDAWGYPLENAEQNVDYLTSKKVPARTFDKIGMVVWLPAGAKVVGW